MHTLEVQSIGQIAGELKISVQRIKSIADALSIVPRVRINHVPHFDAADVERIATFVRESSSEARN